MTLQVFEMITPDRYILLFIISLRSNCGKKTNWKILVPGNVNHDSPSFFGSDKTNFIQRKNARHAGGKGEELRLQSQEDQELGVAAGTNQLILKMTSEYQTGDHTNKIMGSDHDTIFVRFRTTFSNGKTQTLKTVLKRPWVVHTSD